MWVTHVKDLVDSLKTGDTQVVEIEAYWVLRQEINDLLSRAENLKASGIRAQWVLDDLLDHIYGAKDALFNVAVFSRTPMKGMEKIEEIREHVDAMAELLRSMEEPQQ